MANFYASARTNYFKVKDNEAFLNALENIPDIEVCRQHIPPYNAEGIVPKDFDYGGYAILVADGDYGGFPSQFYDDENDVEIEIDLADLIAEHLVDGEVAILMECGAEKLRYVTGWAEAINSKGERMSISLNDIYDIAASLTTSAKEITRCEY